MIVSSLAARLYRLLTERPGRYELLTFKRELRASKTAIIRAADELEEAGLIRREIE